ncbi:cytochrome P450 [Longimycelium tulufanense]|uniref:Cytochrome P450 n=1 Tax=Longimycelium tulufanense TaxID=907463 RepID=A0A8J3CJX9_9PSEU|nr:cytochrome P450 [Longimycelium tulufanense]GGM80663.1 cytochrome P450 [Longimycelium tulufanense]
MDTDADPLPRVPTATCSGPLGQHFPEPGPVRYLPGEDGGVGRWIVTRYADVVAALTDPRLSNKSYAAADPTSHEPNDQLGWSMVAADPPDHTRLRKQVVRAFSAKQVETLRPRVQRIVDELLDAVAVSDEIDLVETFVFPLPVRVICHILGIPRTACDRLLDAAHTAEVPAAGVPLECAENVLREVIDDRHARRTDDLLGGLVTARNNHKLSDTEVLELARLLFVSGHLTTVTLISHGIAALLDDPELRALLRDSPAHVSSMVDELLRCAGPVPSVPRYAVEDVDIGGAVIPGGSYVAVMLMSANHDPITFTDPHAFDIHRRTRDDVAFGHGIHFCLGARLAKMEAELALGTLVGRFPDLAPAGPAPDDRPLSLRVHLHGHGNGGTAPPDRASRISKNTYRGDDRG